MDMQTVGRQIAALRNAKGLTQADLGDRIGVTFQAVSKWERGETLPDTAVLPALADILETTVDRILCAERTVAFKGRCKTADLIEGLRCLQRAGELLGPENCIYRCAVQGINEGMNTDIEAAFSDDYVFEAFLAEAVIQNLKAGFYVDLTDISRSFKHGHFRSIVIDCAKKYNIT